jgi:hypothetical protein
MAIGYVSFAVNSATTSSSSLAVAISPTAGNCLIACGVNAHLASGAPTVATTGGTGSDSFTKSLFLNSPSHTGTNADIQVWLLPVVGTGRTGVTITFPSAVAYCDFHVWQVSGLSNATFDQYAFNDTGTGTSVPMTSGNTPTLSAAAEFCIGYGTGNNSSGTTAAAPWTYSGHSSGVASSSEYQITASTAAVNTNVQSGTNSNWSALAATFMSGAAVTPATAGMMSLMGVG